jgi:predicted peptidase
MSAISCDAGRKNEPAPTDSASATHAGAWEASRLDIVGVGTHQLSAKLPDGGALRYTISVPKGYEVTKSVPLVVALHYGGRVFPFYGRGVIDTLVGPACSELDAIIVAPDAQGDGPWTTETNERLVTWLAQSVMKSYSIDPARVLLTGFSMGGEGAWHIGSRRQELFSAAIPVAGRPAGVTDWKIPVYVIHSRDDSVIPIGPAEQHARELKAKGAPVEWKELSGLTHFDTGRYQDALRAGVNWVRQKWNNPASKAN